ncbi:MAG: hypothetical protein ABMA64_26170 [Myxococcota bacterium]
MRVVAPGKVVLLGEYAVLDGAPAVVAAVDHGVVVTFTPGPIRAVVTPVDDRFARAALDAVGAPAGTYVFADWNPVPGPDKVGLGGSAAATVAAVLVGAPGLDPHTRFRTALAVHRAVQGSGSGVDVAASTYGGVCRFEAEQVTPAPPVAPSVVYSGQPARTGPRVEAYLAWRERSAFVAESRALVDQFGADPVGALRAAGRALRRMADRAGLAYWTDGIDGVVRLAEAHGGAAKPSGAGGGDIVVALFDAPEGRLAFEEAARAGGYRVVPCAVAPGAAVAG